MVNGDIRRVAINTAQALRRCLAETRHYQRARLAPAQWQFSEEELRLAAELQRNGVAVAEGFWPRERALALGEKLRRYVAEAKDQDFDCGAYLRFRREGQTLAAQDADDAGVSRIYQVDLLEPELAAFRHEPLVLNVAAAYYGMPMFSGLLQFQHNAAGDYQTRYFHVDAFEREFKSFLYLDDVDETNGPFCYLRGSHQAHWLRAKKQVLGNRQGPITSFFPQEMSGLIGSEWHALGPAGTLILADVRGLHRGMPQQGRERAVLVNYFYEYPRTYQPAK